MTEIYSICIAHTLYHKQAATQGHFLSKVQMVWIQFSFS